MDNQERDKILGQELVRHMTEEQKQSFFLHVKQYKDYVSECLKGTVTLIPSIDIKFCYEGFVTLKK